MKSTFKYLRYCDGCNTWKWCNTYSKLGSQFDYCSSCSDKYVTKCKYCGDLISEEQSNDGYCKSCVKNVIQECKECGSECMPSEIQDGICLKCINEEIKQCSKCNKYFDADMLNEDGLCSVCSLKLFKKKKKELVDEVECCLECGKEFHVKDLNNKCICEICEMKEQISKLSNKINKNRRKQLNK